MVVAVVVVIVWLLCVLRLRAAVAIQSGMNMAHEVICAPSVGCAPSSAAVEGRGWGLNELRVAREARRG